MVAHLANLSRIALTPQEIEKLTGVSRHRLRPDVFGARPARLAPPRKKTPQVTA